MSDWNDLLACESYTQPVIPPAPLTGDAGRGCGDASRAPLFFGYFAPFRFPPTIRLPLEIGSARRDLAGSI